MVDLYIGRSVEELLRLLKATQDRMPKGNITEVSAAGVRTVRDFSNSGSIKQQIEQIRYSLFVRSNGEYPDPRLERATKTRPRYAL